MKHLFLGGFALSAALLVGGCLRMVDEPVVKEKGEAGADCFLDNECPDSFCREDGTCAEAGLCNSHFQCDDGHACIDEHCEEVECASYDDVNACGTYRCDGDAFKCFAACESDNQCSEGNVCREGECVSPKCTAENEAVMCLGYTCDTVLSECRQPDDYVNSCSEKGCAAGYTCVDDYDCKKACDIEATEWPECGDYGCREQFTANGYEGVCEDSCSDHDECFNGTVCVDFKCVAQ